MPLIFHWHTNYDNLLKVQHFKDNRSSNLASALLHGTHPVTQRLRIDPQLAANTLDSTLAASRISTSLQRHTRRTLTQLQRVLTLTRHPKPPIRPKTLSTIPGTHQGPPKSMHTVPDTNVPKTQTTSPTTPRFHRFLPRWSALWRAHRLTSWPHCRRSGGMALHERQADVEALAGTPPLGGNGTT